MNIYKEIAILATTIGIMLSAFLIMCHYTGRPMMWYFYLHSIWIGYVLYIFIVGLWAAWPMLKRLKD